MKPKQEQQPTKGRNQERERERVISPSERYTQMIEKLAQRYTEALRGKKIVMSEADYLRGVDKLSPELAELSKKTIIAFQNENKYELSYSQVCNAFFKAAHKLKVLELVPKHPKFRLYTKVWVKFPNWLPIQEKVPGIITSFNEDTHIVTVGDDVNGRSCYRVELGELDSVLTLREKKK